MRCNIAPNQSAQVDLYCECPLWPDDGMCSLRDCSVCECEEQEVPEPWRKAEAVEGCNSERRWCWCVCVCGWGWGWGGGQRHWPELCRRTVWLASLLGHAADVQLESDVDRTLAPHVKANLLSVRDWRGYRNPWMPEGGESQLPCHSPSRLRL